MRTVVFKTPAMYGDHHVKEVRRILTGLPGVQDVYASSAFRVVEVSFDESQAAEADLAAKLGEAGYLDEWMLPTENGRPATEQADKSEAFFRHTQVFETSRKVLGFSQQVPYSGRPLWNCPGFGMIKNKMED